MPGAAAAWNVVPGVAGGLALWLEKALPEHFSVYLEVAGLVSGDTRVKQSSGSFTTSSVAVDAAACVIPLFGESVRGRFCAGLEARTVLASGSGFQISRDAVLDWFSVANSAGLSVAILPKWALVGYRQAGRATGKGPDCGRRQQRARRRDPRFRRRRGLAIPGSGLRI